MSDQRGDAQPPLQHKLPYIAQHNHVTNTRSLVHTNSTQHMQTLNTPKDHQLWAWGSENGGDDFITNCAHLRQVTRCNQ